MRKPKRPEETTVLPTQEAPGFFDAPFAQDAPPHGEAASYGTAAPHVAAAPYANAAPNQHADPADVTVETIVVRVRRHGRHLAPAIVLLFLVSGAAGYFIGWFPELWMNLAAAVAAALLAIFGGVGPVLGWLSHRAVVTTRRVIVHRGFFVRHRTEISLARVREVRSKQNPIQRMWGSGDIDLFVGSESTRISDAPRVKELHAALQELSERSYDEQLRAARFGAY